MAYCTTTISVGFLLLAFATGCIGCRDCSKTYPQHLDGQGLDKAQCRSKIPEIPAKYPFPQQAKGRNSGFMTPKSPPPRESADVKQSCKHPRVQIVSRDEDSEFVECKECGEIFESSEFKDMNIEESAREKEV